MADLEASLLLELGEQGNIADSGDFATKLGVEHGLVVGIIKSLQASEMITVEVPHLAGRHTNHQSQSKDQHSTKLITKPQLCPILTPYKR